MISKLGPLMAPATYLSGGTAVVAGLNIHSWAAIVGALAAITTAVANIIFKIREEHQRTRQVIREEVRHGPDKR